MALHSQSSQYALAGVMNGSIQRGGRYILVPAIGQTVVGVAANGRYTVTSGFWSTVDGPENEKTYLPLIQS